MRTKTTLAAVLVLPLLLMACDRADNSPTAAVPDQSQEKQAMSPDKMLERSPPATGPATSIDQPAAPGAVSGQSTAPGTADMANQPPQDAPKKAY